jgi:hypothetical protein
LKDKLERNVMGNLGKVFYDFREIFEGAVISFQIQDAKIRGSEAERLEQKKNKIGHKEG